MFDYSLILLAAFFAGALNAVAGGGSFLTFPALVFIGVPPVIANATGTVAMLPGYIAGAWGFRDDMEPPPGLSLKWVALISVLGGAVGAALLLVTPDATFSYVVPWLLLGATAMFAFGPKLREWVSRQEHAKPSAAKAGLGVFAVASYGGYFNGGLGIMLLALFGLLGQTRLNAMNGMKNVVSALLTFIAVVVYAYGQLVQWKEALIMMVAAAAGGYLGARLARRIPVQWLRGGIVAVGLVMTLLFFARS